MKRPSLMIPVPGQPSPIDDQHAIDADGKNGRAVVVESKPLPTLPLESKIDIQRPLVRPRKTSIFIEHCHEESQEEPDDRPQQSELRIPRDESWPLSRYAEAGLGTYRSSPVDLHRLYTLEHEQADTKPPEITIPPSTHHPQRKDPSPSTKKRKRVSKARGSTGRSLGDLLQATVRKSTPETFRQSECAAKDEPRDTSLGYRVSQDPKLPGATNNTTVASISSSNLQSREERRQPTSTASVLLDIRPASRLGNRTSLNVRIPNAFSPLRLPEMEAGARKKKAERASRRRFTNPFASSLGHNHDELQAEASTSYPHDGQRASRQWYTTDCVRCAAYKLKQLCMSEIRIFLPILAGLLLAWTCLWCAITFMATEISQHGHNQHFTPAIIWFSTSLVSCIILTSILSCLVTRREVMARREQAGHPIDEESGASTPYRTQSALASRITTRQRSATQPVPFEYDPANGIRAFLDNSNGVKKLSDASSETISPGTGQRHQVTLSRVLSAGIRKPPAWQEMNETSITGPSRGEVRPGKPSESTVRVHSESAGPNKAWWRVSKDSDRLRRYIEHLEAQYEIVRRQRVHNGSLRSRSFEDLEAKEADKIELSVKNSNIQGDLRLSAIGLAYSTPASEEGPSQEQTQFEYNEHINDDSFVSAHQFPVSKHAGSISSYSSVRTISYASQSSTGDSNPFNLYTMDNVTSAGIQNYTNDEPLLKSRISTVDDLPHPYDVEDNLVFDPEHSTLHRPSIDHQRELSEEDIGTMEMQILSNAAVQGRLHEDMYSPLDGGFLPALITTPVTGSCDHRGSIRSPDHDLSADGERTPTATKISRLDSVQSAAIRSRHLPEDEPHTPLQRIVTEAGTPLEDLSVERQPSFKHAI